MFVGGFEPLERYVVERGLRHAVMEWRNKGRKMVVVVVVVVDLVVDVVVVVVVVVDVQ